MRQVRFTLTCGRRTLAKDVDNRSLALPAPPTGKISAFPLSLRGRIEENQKEHSSTDSFERSRHTEQLREHLLIYLRGQTLSDNQLEVVVRRFDTLKAHDFIKPLEGRPFMIADEARDVKVVGEDWYSDAP